MGISDVLYESIADIIDGCIMYYNDDDNILKLTECEEVVEAIAGLLKSINKADCLKSDLASRISCDAKDWRPEAKEYIQNYIFEHYA